MVGLLDLVQLAQQHTWFMVVLLWLGSGLAYRSLSQNQEAISSDVETLDDNQDQITEQVNRVDQKQDHIVSRQEMVLERMGMNAQEIQELREDTARLDERHRNEGDFFRGSKNAGDQD